MFSKLVDLGPEEGEKYLKEVGTQRYDSIVAVYWGMFFWGEVLENMSGLSGLSGYRWHKPRGSDLFISNQSEQREVTARTNQKSKQKSMEPFPSVGKHVCQLLSAGKQLTCDNLGETRKNQIKISKTKVGHCQKTNGSFMLCQRASGALSNYLL